MAHFQYKEQQFQKDAVNAVADVFRGVDFAPLPGGQGFDLTPEGASGEVGIARDNYVLGNFGDTIRDNLQEVQKRSGIAKAPVLDGGYPVLDTQMETGTGKTFTFINTIFELHKRHGLTHFIVIVPSVAIREGVKKSFATTARYFERIYHRRINVREITAARQNRKGRKAPPSGVSDFIHTGGLTALVMTNHSFNSANRVINQQLEGFFAGDAKTPMAAIAAKNPVLIIDEPHRVEGKQTQKHIANFNPLFVLRYSATFAETMNPVYALDSYDAFAKKLVKSIAVADYQTSAANAAFLGVNKITAAGAELTAADANGKPLIITAQKPDAEDGESLLHAKTKNREYAAMRITAIDIGGQKITLSDGRMLEAGKYDGRAQENEDIVDEVMMRDTIRRHLQKERELFARGVKCISLFFIDRVRDYRDYESESGRGRLQPMFERCYEECAKEAMKDAPEAYKNYLRRQPASAAHGGYFSGDKGRNKKIDAGGAAKGDEEARKLQQEITELILRDKEEVLNPGNNLRFIFAHSALREGWDNPNVFQICKLRTGYSETGRVQEVGRGLRLCVNGDLARLDAEALGDDFAAVNRLDVFTLGDGGFIASLQKELGARRFADKAGYVEVTPALLEEIYGIKSGRASRIVVALIDAGCIDEDNRLLTKGGIAEVLAAAGLDANKLLAKLPQTPDIKDARQDDDKVKQYKARESQYEKFKALWQMLHQKVDYQVEYSPDLIAKITGKLDDDGFYVPPLYLKVTTGTIRAGDDDFAADAREATRREQLKSNMSVRVFLARLEEKTRLPRNTIIDILSGIKAEKFDQIRANPFLAIERLAEVINGVIHQNIVDNIRYIRRGGLRETYITLSDKTFTARRYLTLPFDGYKDNNLWEDIAPYDSDDPEKKISEDALVDGRVIVFAKLPRKVNIPSPMHPKGISPDFAFVVPGADGGRDYYFVAEAKPTTDTDALERDGRLRAALMTKYFRDISADNIQFKVVSSYADLLQMFAEHTGGEQ